MFYPCKITVIKKEFNKELINTYLGNPQRMKICNRMEENQEFFVSNPFDMPENICASAWADIRPYIITIATGGEFNFIKNKKSTLAMCTDPFRPVIFKIERKL